MLRIVLLWICSIVFFPSLAFSNPVPIRHLGINQGLSNNSVRCIYQDHNGFMWFGTYDGLNRYDGYEFKVFRNKLDDTTSLPYNFIYTIHEDLQHNIWVGTGQGIGIYNNLTSKFLPAYYIPVDKKAREKITFNVNVIETDAKGNVYIGTNGSGLMIHYKGREAAEQIPIYKDGKPTTIYNVVAIKVDQKQRVWLINDLGLYMYDVALKQMRVVNTRIPTVSSLETDGQENIWIGTVEGLYKYHVPSGLLVKAYAEGTGQLTSSHIVSLCLDRQRNLWIGTAGGGSDILDTKTGKFTYLLPGENKNALSSESVFSIYEDKEGRKWMGTLKGGIDIIDPHIAPFQTIVHDPFNPASLINNFVSCFCEDKEENLWIGTDGGGLSVWNRKRNTFTNFQHQLGNPRSLSNNQVSSIRQDYLGNIWIATFGSGINKFNPATQSFERFACINEVSGGENNNVWLLFEDSYKVLWATTFARGKLYRFNRQQNRFEVFNQKFNDLISLVEDKSGTVWAGNSHQLIKIDRQNNRHTIYDIGKPIRSLYEDKKGHFWMGLEGGGLALFDRQQGKIAIRYSSSDGLCNNAVLNILEDDSSCLWLSTFNGLAKFDPEKKIFKNYYQGDGLQSNQFLYSASLRLKAGEFAFGGIKGFNIFFPDDIRPFNNKPPVLLTELRINNNPVTAGSGYITSASGSKIEALKIPYNENAVSFDFAALEYSMPEKIAYAYYLQGWDKGWNNSGTVRTANYTRLNEGSYVLRIKATTADGNWNPREVSLEIVVLPPWYRSWWAIALYTLMAGGAIVLYQRYRAYQSKLKYEMALSVVNAGKEKAEREKAQAEYQKQQAELETERAEHEKGKAELAREQAERETERVKSEQEKKINEKRLSFFTNVSHEFRTPLTLIINPLKDILQKNDGEEKAYRNELNTVYRNAHRLMSLIDQLLLFRKAEDGADRLRIRKLDFYSLCREVYLAFVLQAGTLDIHYMLECPDKALNIYADREKLEIILFNLISNALKYTPKGGTVTFAVQEMEEAVEVRVSDNGYGIPKEIGNNLFDRFYQVHEKGVPPKPGFGIGLFLVKYFVESHKGIVSYESEPGKGTTFFIQLLKGKEHFGNEPIFEEAVTEQVFLKEWVDDNELFQEEKHVKEKKIEHETLINENPLLLVVDDDEQIRTYIAQLFENKFAVYQAGNGEEGLKLAGHYVPDIIICDVNMLGMNGIELCRSIKEDASLSHIPVILLTGSSSAETRLEGVEGGADDYITKPFEKELLIARVTNILKSRTTLQKYFYNEVTLQSNDLKVSEEYKTFLENCIVIVEAHLDDENFSIQTLADEAGMSYSKLYKKIKSMSGQSVNAFIRYIRLRKAADLFINSSMNVNETAFQVGISNMKYFRAQFSKLFGINPSEYIKKYRKAFGNSYRLNKDISGAYPKDHQT